MNKILYPFLIIFFGFFSIVSALGQKPKATIIQPESGFKYVGGQEILFLGSGITYDGKELPESAFKWLVNMHHGSGTNEHWHDGIATFLRVKQGSFTIPLGDSGDNIYYRFYLIVTNNGVSDTAFLDILPKTIKITINSNPQGIPINIPSFTNSNTPVEIYGTINQIFQLDSKSTTFYNGINYKFMKWNNGSTNINEGFMIPNSDTTITAFFEIIESLDVELFSNYFKLYPNPVKDEIKLENIGVNGSIDVCITDETGKTHLKNNYNVQKGSILSIPSLFSNGSYIIKIALPDNKFIYSKILKQ